ncbi:neuroglobin-like [Liolophura sinensis]|uniref:neuroglobin-like n=1 Tax=Liolophura sinensis TaxID=3198878 RepID=UPI00315935CE
MGCTVSTAINTLDVKQKNAKKAAKNETIKEKENGEKDKFDPRLPLTVRQKFNITKSWKAIARNMEVTGINMFVRLFETNDMVRTLFKHLEGFKNVTDLRESTALENHVKMVMYTLDEAIASLDDVDFVVDMLTSVGKSHQRLEGFDPEIFWEIQQPFLMAVKETLEDRYTANMEHIYRKVIEFILQTLIDGFRGETTPVSEDKTKPPPDNSICQPE